MFLNSFFPLKVAYALGALSFYIKKKKKKKTVERCQEENYGSVK